MELLKEYLNENYYILIPVLWVLGYALKQTPKIVDWLIIWILLAASVLLAIFAYGFTFQAITNGILATGVSVLGHQMWNKQNPFKQQNRKKP
ncbi:phage holin family protein [Niallia sp. NCCP-28]|uniref:phage holin family protein n=1 Tax=Niallia sp. NCCP-28 TaxID=2934712 RepID=UPI0020832133|nr:phage holin family protein [Niallia sp. NCCP-28]GKU82760.1 hypothetical protein NCCP28_21560 [Niallia sp. NCCP-28]